MSIDTLSPYELVTRMRDAKQHRASLVYDTTTRRLRVSHPVVQPLADALDADTRDFDRHEGIFLELGPRTGALHGAFLHRTIRGQGAGGVRYWPYATLLDYARDGLRLARGMGRKNALAGLWWGGAKGVIARQPDDRHRDPAFRRELYREYGAFITSLRGCYVTAEDAGTQAADMAEIFGTTRFVTCIPPEVGGSGVPSIATARGVVSAMEAALDFLGLGSLQGKRIAMQGAGNVGTPMIDFLLERGVSAVVATDISPEQIAAASARFSGRPVTLRLVSPQDTSILAEPCDIFAPNALGGILHPETIALLRARIVCGAANNQLLDDRRDDQALADRGITYVPDYLANRMGIVNCANEQYGSWPGDPAIERHLGREWENSVFLVARKVLERAKEQGTTTARAANAMADELSMQPHPVWGHRSKLIIESLVRDRWHEGTSLPS